MRFGSKARIGIEIKDDSVHAVEVVGTRHNLRVSRSVSFPIEPGWVVDGDIQSPEELGYEIRKQLETNDFRAKSAQVVVPSRFVVIRQLALPKLPKHDVQLAIEFELQNNIHLPFDESVFDFAKLEIKKGRVETFSTGESILEGDVEVENQDQYVVVAAARDVVERIVETAEIASLKVKAVDVRALALHRLYIFAHEQESNEEQSLVFVDVGEYGSDIHIFRNSFLLFTRNVPLPLSNYKKQNGNLTPDVQSQGIEESAIDFQLFAQDLAFELERSINFYQYSLNNRDQRISKVILSGKIKNTESVTGFLSNRLDVAIDRIHTEHLVDHETYQLNQDMVLQNAVAIGLAIREEKRSWK